MISIPLYFLDGVQFSKGYERVVHGGRGAYVELTKEQILVPLKSKYNIPLPEKIDLQPFYYYYLIPEGRDEKIYWQIKTVKYADYKIGYYYISPDLLMPFKEETKINTKNYFKMKKLFILVMLLLITSCVVLTPRYVFQRTYEAVDSSLVIKDVYNQLNKYGVDSIPLDMWITSYMSMDTNKYVQKTIRYESICTDEYTCKKQKPQKKYTFVYTKFIYPYRTYYEFKVRYLGK